MSNCEDEVDPKERDIENLRKEAVSGMATVFHAGSMAMVSETVNLLSWLLGVYGGTWIVLISVFRHELSYDPIVSFATKLLLLATLIGMIARVLAYNLRTLLTIQEKSDSVISLEKKADYIIDNLINKADISQEEKLEEFISILKSILRKMCGRGMLSKAFDLYIERTVDKAVKKGGSQAKHTPMSKSTLYAVWVDRAVLLSFAFYCNVIITLLFNGVII